MAHSLHDVNSQIGHGPTISGRAALQKFFQTQDASAFPAMNQLLTHGVTDKLPALTVEASSLASRCTNPKVKSTLESLANDSRKAKEIVILAA